MSTVQICLYVTSKLSDVGGNDGCNHVVSRNAQLKNGASIFVLRLDTLHGGNRKVLFSNFSTTQHALPLLVLFLTESRAEKQNDFTHLSFFINSYFLFETSENNKQEISMAL